MVTKDGLVLMSGKIFNTLYLTSGFSDVQENKGVCQSKFNLVNQMRKQKGVIFVVSHVSLEKSSKTTVRRKSVRYRSRVRVVSRPMNVLTEGDACERLKLGSTSVHLLT